MNRRALFATLAAASAAAQTDAKAIQLHVDLAVDPTRDKDLKRNFKEVFKPALLKQPGALHVYMLKLREVKAGQSAGGANYRLVIHFRSEEERLAWVKSADHQRAWPMIEGTLKGKSQTTILYDVL